MVRRGVIVGVDGLQMWRVADKISKKKQSRTTDKGKSSSFRIRGGRKNSFP
jgi:hypothetical protein